MFSIYKTRLAPTPSGYLHRGNAANFLLTAALAQRTGAKLLLRIDDNDSDRYRPAYAQHIFDVLAQLGIHFSEGPKNLIELENEWSQQHRLPLYNKAIQTLIEKKALFACTCSRTAVVCTCMEKSLPIDTANAALKLHTAPDAIVHIKNLIGETTTVALQANMLQPVIRRRNGLPAYHLCSVVDDVHFGIDLIVRGEDLWTSTIVQQLLATAMDAKQFCNAAFVHHPLLLSNEGNKLSKSAGDGKPHTGTANFSEGELAALHTTVNGWMSKLIIK